MWSRKSHKAQLGDGSFFVGDFATLILVFVGGGGAGVDKGTIGSVQGGGCDIVSIHWTSVNMICGVWVGLGG